MPTLKLTFHRLIQDSQDINGKEHMVSRVFFSVDVDNNHYPDLYADIKQTVGASSAEPIEVGSPSGGYNGPWSHAKFQEAAEAYYRSFVGPGARGINIASTSQVRMRNNSFERRAEISFIVPSSDVSW
jgi:hypothetical protein